jgi:hypothetical protein
MQTAAPSWQNQIIATRTSCGRIFLLLGLRKETCPHCRYGIHFDTTWGSPQGEIHRISWCKSCFNAECAHEQLRGKQRAHWKHLVQLASREPILNCWSSARPAIEDLEHRGLI